MKKKWMVRAGALALGITMLAGAAAVMPTNNANWLDGAAHADEELYTVTYDDGEPDVDIFEKQVYTDLHKGSMTPSFNGSPSWEGHKFRGWTPEIASTVNGDVHDIVYLASWSEEDTGDNTENKGDEDKTSFTVAYTDGTEDASIFGVQAHTGLKKGELTPAFNGTPEREGYIFTGWNPEIAATVSEDVTYVATWKEAEKTEEKYTVTYNDGISDVEIFKDQVYGDLAKDAKTPAFDGTPTREGYVFDGWNPAVAETVTANVTYEAVWRTAESVEYTITYTDGVADAEIFKDQVYGGRKKDDKTPAFDGTPTREGYTFKGWNPAVSETVTGNATYEAVWEKGEEAKCTITYNDGVPDKEIFKDQVYEAKKGAKTPAYNGTPKRDGYTFEGWNPKVAETVSGSVTYEAVWKASEDKTEYKITYTDGVTGAQLFKDQTYKAKKGDKTPAFNGTPTRKGYVFDGWNPSVSDTVTGDATYAAKWKAEGEITYKVVYTDGVTGAELFKDQTYTDLKKGDKTPAFNGTPTREGYTFNGWSPKVATNLDTAKADKDHVITYAATWKEAKASVSGNSTTKGSGSLRSDVDTGRTETVKTGEEDVIPFILGFMGVAALAGVAFFYARRRTAKN